MQPCGVAVLTRVTRDDGDLSSLARLVEEWAADLGTPGEREFAQRFIAEWEARNDGVAWVARDDEGGVGFVSAVQIGSLPWPTVESAGRQWLHVSGLYVTMQNRRQGVGTALLAAMGAWAERQGIHRIEVAADDASRAVYTKAGFTRQHRSMTWRLG